MRFLAAHKNLIVAVIVIALAFMAYTMFFRGGEQGALSVTSPEGAAGGVEQELLATLLELRTVELDGAIFTDPAFRSLRDFSQPLEPQPVGRNNPFAPL